MSRIFSLDVRKANIAAVGQNVAERLRPSVLAHIYNEGRSKDLVFLFSHPAVNFLRHYLLEPLYKRGVAAMSVTTRHTDNDSTLLMERVIQDVGTAVQYLRREGYRKIVLVGNSGGGPLMSLYQSQAENLTIKTTPDGRPFDIIPEDLPPADAVALLSAHSGRHLYFRSCLDPSVIDENDPLAIDPELDMYTPRNGPPYSQAFLERFAAGQRARHHRLTEWAVSRLREFEATKAQADDQAFVIHRTYAKPATLDHTIDPNDRAPGDTTIYGKAEAVNYSAGTYGRFNTLRSFLSQWSELSIADGPARLAETTVPCLNVEYSADEGCLPAETHRYSEVLGDRCENRILRGAIHFPFLQPNAEEIIGQAADMLIDWAKKHP